eukprot:m.95348 g.95348  ORF g.95348 m.95348 type:complete len:409 (-) comp21914_c0_seq1:55-1281(-)
MSFKHTFMSPPETLLRPLLRAVRQQQHKQAQTQTQTAPLGSSSAVTSSSCFSHTHAGITAGFSASPASRSPPLLHLRSASSSSGTSVRSAVCYDHTKPLKIQHLPRKPIQGSEVRLKVHCAAINFADILTTQGKYQVQPDLPFVAGSEIAGEVIEVGEDVPHLSVGQRVVGIATSNGGFADECVVLYHTLFSIPDKLSFDKAVAVPIAYGTAFVGLDRRAKLQNNETLLVTAAAGGVGLAAVDLGKHVFGANVIAAARGASKLELTKQYGAEHTIDYSEESVKNCVKELGGADVVFDAVGGKVLEDCIRAIKWEGRILVIGFASGTIPKVPANLLLLKNSALMGLFWGQYGTKDYPVLKGSIDKCLAFAAEGKINPHVCKTFSLEQINEAFEYILSRKSTGKVVIKCT